MGSKIQVLDLLVHDGAPVAVCRLGPKEAIPAWATRGEFFSVTRTDEELSVVCDQALVPEGIKAESEWNWFKVQGPLDFALVGILAGLADALAKAGVSIFALSTFDTDYVLFRKKDLKATLAALKGAGHRVRTR